MKKRLLVLFTLWTGSILAEYTPSSDPLYINSSSQKEYGIFIRIDETTPSSTSVDIHIEVPLTVKSEKFIDIHLVSRNPDSRVNIPLHYTIEKGIVQHAPPGLQAQKTKESDIARAALCLPKAWLNKCIVSVRCENREYVIKLEQFIVQPADSARNPDSTGSNGNPDGRGAKKETIISFGEVHRYPQDYEIVTGPNTAPVVIPKGWKNMNRGVELRVTPAEETDGAKTEQE